MTKTQAAKDLVERIGKMANKEAVIVENTNGTFDVIAKLTLEDISYTGSKDVVFEITARQLSEYFDNDPDMVAANF